MSRHTALRIEVLVLAGIGLLLVGGPAMAQQGWPINGSNWSLYGSSGGTSSYSPSYNSSYSPSYSFGRVVVPYSGYPYAVVSGDYYNSDPIYRFSSSAAYSYSAYSPTQENTARIRLVVPADAKVWFENKATKQGGEVRHFESPPLVPGHDYFYDLKVQWRDNAGQEVTRTRQLKVTANAQVIATFTRQ